jgi:hypothetical protein
MIRSDWKLNCRISRIVSLRWSKNASVCCGYSLLRAGGSEQINWPAVERDTKSALDEAHYTSLDEAVKDARTEIEHREK